MKRYTLWLLFSTMIAFAAAAQSQVPSNQVPPSIQKRVESLRADLEARGFEVAQGAWKLFTIDDCKYAIATFGNCFGNNPTAPYIVPTVPLWPNEFVDKSMKDAFGPTADNTWWTYRLDPREALVVVGLMPPPGAYFGLQSYVFSREGAVNVSDPIYRSLTDPFMRSILFLKAPTPSRALVFSSIGDSTNNAVIERRSGGAFDRERSFIITPDAVMERRLTDALLRAGVPDRNQIFTEHVSADIVRLGLGARSDDMMTLMRYALPDDEVSGDQWRQQLPLVVLRVRDRNTKRATEPYPAPVRDARTARSELGLKDDAGKLVMAVKQKWGQPDAATTSFESLLLKVDLLGPHCLKRPQDCLGDSSDADYQISATVSMDSGEVLSAVGTLGTATGNATYTSLSVNQIPALKGIVNISHKDLVGSASAFSAAIPDTGKFYVQFFARDCRNLDHCFQVTEDMVPRGDSIKIIQRNYVVPGSLRGPDPTQVANPTLIVFHGEGRHAGR
jgi:hypothetical protein